MCFIYYDDTLSQLIISIFRYFLCAYKSFTQIFRVRFGTEF